MILHSYTILFPVRSGFGVSRGACSYLGAGIKQSHERKLGEGGLCNSQETCEGWGRNTEAVFFFSTSDENAELD